MSFDVEQVYGTPIYKCTDDNGERIFVYDSVIFTDNDTQTLAIMRSKISYILLDHEEECIKIYTVDDDYEAIYLSRRLLYELFRVLIPANDSEGYKSIG